MWRHNVIVRNTTSNSQTCFIVCLLFTFTTFSNYFLLYFICLVVNIVGGTHLLDSDKSHWVSNGHIRLGAVSAKYSYPWHNTNVLAHNTESIWKYPFYNIFRCMLCCTTRDLVLSRMPWTRQKAWRYCHSCLRYVV